MEDTTDDTEAFSVGEAEPQFTTGDNLSIHDYSTEEFYGLDVLDCPLPQIDDDIQYLHESDREAVFNASPENWTDCLISDVGEESSFVLDTATKTAWEECKNELKHLEMRLPSLLNLEPTEKVSLPRLLDFVFGSSSDISSLLCRELSINPEEFDKFLGTLCLQMSYVETPSSMYDKFSELKTAVLMNKEDYMNIWEKIASLKRVDLRNYVGTSRCDQCLWEKLEVIANNIMREISIVGRTDHISSAADDDKIWVESTGRNAKDDFGLRRVTHVKDNRKGIISHTATTTGLNVPIGFIFERNGWTAVDCFMHLFGSIFPSSGGASNLPNLQNVTNHSDRGYTLEKTIFNFMIPAGADLTNTVKRVMPFPFLWGMKPKRNDTRELLDEKGTPALFIKQISKSGRLVSCVAFRTGTNNISAIITTRLHSHQWEGICVNPKQRILYEEDPEHGLDPLLFEMVGQSSFVEQYKDEVKSLLDDLLIERINVITLEQGTADWHKARQFSMTSSQADGSFRKALIINQSDDDWCNTAEYLFGSEYHNSEFLSLN